MNDDTGGGGSEAMTWRTSVHGERGWRSVESSKCKATLAPLISPMAPSSSADWHRGNHRLGHVVMGRPAMAGSRLVRGLGYFVGCPVGGGPSESPCSHSVGPNTQRGSPFLVGPKSSCGTRWLSRNSEYSHGCAKGQYYAYAESYPFVSLLLFLKNLGDRRTYQLSPTGLLLLQR